MNPYLLTDADIQEARVIEGIYSKLKQSGAGELERITHEMSFHQPFLISLLSGYQKDVPLGAFNFIAETFAVMWEYFKDKHHIRNIPLTMNAYQVVERKNVEHLVAFNRLVARDRTALINRDWTNMRSKILFTMITGKWNTSPDIQVLDKATSGIVLLGVSSVIEALDNIVQGKISGK